MTRSARHLALGAVAAATLLAACGSSSSSGSGGGVYGGGGGGGVTTVAAAPGTGAAATAAGGGATPAAGAGAVSIKGFAFNPGDVTVKAGTKVTWTNNDSATHRIKSGDGSFDSDDLGNGATFDHTFGTAGKFAYICGIHPSMKGTITVTA